MFPHKLSAVSLDRGGPEVLRERVARQSPALIDDFSKSLPVLDCLTPEYLRSYHGHKPVPVYDASFGEPGPNYMGSIGSMTLSDFLEATLSEGRDLRMFLYNVGRQLPELLEDVAFPEMGLRLSRRFVYAFAGCRGATTPLHYDIDMGCVLHTVTSGRRRVRLFAPDQSAALQRHPFTVRSYANLERPDFSAYPALDRARGYEVVMEPGQTLFMPAGYWHEFHYLDPGFGVSLRAGSPRLRDRARGAANLLVTSPIDRLGNRLGGRHWFAWKERRARALAAREGQA
jgi:hypothetical protein